MVSRIFGFNQARGISPRQAGWAADVRIGRAYQRRGSGVRVECPTVSRKTRCVKENQRRFCEHRWVMNKPLSQPYFTEGAALEEVDTANCRGMSSCTADTTNASVCSPKRAG